MSYPKDLDDYDDEDLLAELVRRRECRKQGLCDYCGRKGAEPSCKHEHRHCKVSGLDRYALLLKRLNN